MSALSFQALCCCCFRDVIPSNGGIVLSCGDFLCVSCASSRDLRQCPACNKIGVRSAKLLDENLPKEVVQNMSDLTSQLEVLHSTLLFQVKHYKVTVKRAASAMVTTEKGGSER